MDVKIEGQNAVRHLDLTTNNHASTPGDTPPWPYADAMMVSTGDPCERKKKMKLQPAKTAIRENRNVTLKNVKKHKNAN
jgi:hypothetical protein